MQYMRNLLTLKHVVYICYHSNIMGIEKLELCITIKQNIQVIRNEA